MKKIKRIAFGTLAMLMAFTVVGCDNGIGENGTGYYDGYDAGYQAGLAAGKQDGYGDGYELGYDDAYTDGAYDDGYSKGYEDGFAAGGGGSGDTGDEEEIIVGETDYSKVDNGTGKLTIYLDESQVYGVYQAGSQEAAVEAAISEKFKQDTGLNLDLEIMYESHATFTNKFGAVMAGGDWDAAVGYLGQAGLNETVLTQDVTLDLSNYIGDYYNIRRAVDKKAFYATTTLEDEIIGIPSVNNTKMKSLLIRKDYMTQVGYTESKAEADASGGTLKYCQTINDFDDMLRKMKAQIPECTMPLIGNYYDIEFTILAGACGTAGYQYSAVNYNEDGSVKEVVPGWLSEGYQDVLNWEYKWQKDGIWEKDHTVKQDTQRLSDYTNGKGAVYCVDPTVTNLIDVARQVKAVNPNAEFTVLNPLDAVDENGDAIEGSGAFAEVSRTQDCLIINKKSENAELMLAYLDWMYSSVENYELCAYGIEGRHWEKDGDGYYKYPAGKETAFERTPPYSGAFALLHNDEYTYRRYTGYKEYEAWIESAENANTIKNPTDGMLMYNMTADMSNAVGLAESEMYAKCTTPAWNGTADPATTYPTYVALYKEQVGYGATKNGVPDDTKDYIRWLTNQYNFYMLARKK
ncbi:MAG: hypothetical protein IJ329_00155 [Clostridia bacterium]|nr:hypothetical protein [Clostridia bacterium]